MPRPWILALSNCIRSSCASARTKANKSSIAPYGSALPCKSSEFPASFTTTPQAPGPQAGQGLSPALTPFVSSTKRPLRIQHATVSFDYMPVEQSSEEVSSGLAETDESKAGFSAFGNALMCLVLALFLFVAPWYFLIGTMVGSFLGDSVGSIVGISISAVCYVGALVFAFYTASFVLSAFDAPRA